jgi:hypothetical protein
MEAPPHTSRLFEALPAVPGSLVLKRVVGLPGDTIECRTRAKSSVTARHWTNRTSRAATALTTAAYR